MRWSPLLLCTVLLMCVPISGEPASASTDYTTRVVNSFETGVEESTTYGSWAAKEISLGGGNFAEVVRTDTAQYHGTYSAMLHIVTDGDPDEGALASMTFTSNSSLGTFMFDSLRIGFRFGKVSGSTPVGTCELEQWNSSGQLDAIKLDLDLCSWSDLVLSPLWDAHTTYWLLEFTLGEDELEATESVMYLDYFRFDSDAVDVRVRYWNLYTGLGYYIEKLLCRYYTFEGGWVDVWQNEFTAYKGDEVLIAVTDIFGRDVWTGFVDIDSTPVYVDVLVPIVTVCIAVPDWYNDSVPMEWQITCLPWGPDGTRGMTLSAIGFEFEVLAGWYSLAWLQTNMVAAGNLSLYITGNASSSSSMMLTDLTIPINPDYEVAIEGDDGQIFDLRSFDDFVAMLAALGQDNRFQAVSVILVMLSVLTYTYQAKKLAREARQAQQRNDRRGRE